MGIATSCASYAAISPSRFRNHAQINTRRPQFHHSKKHCIDFQPTSSVQRCGRALDCAKEGVAVRGLDGQAQ